MESQSLLIKSLAKYISAILIGINNGKYDLKFNKAFVLGNVYFVLLNFEIEQSVVL